MPERMAATFAFFRSWRENELGAMPAKAFASHQAKRASLLGARTLLGGVLALLLRTSTLLLVTSALLVVTRTLVVTRSQAFDNKHHPTVQTQLRSLGDMWWPWGRVAQEMTNKEQPDSTFSAPAGQRWPWTLTPSNLIAKSLLLVVRPGAPSSVLAPSSDARSP